MITRLAPIRLTPNPPTRVVRRKRNIEESFKKELKFEFNYENVKNAKLKALVIILTYDFTRRKGKSNIIPRRHRTEIFTIQ